MELGTDIFFPTTVKISPHMASLIPSMASIFFEKVKKLTIVLDCGFYPQIDNMLAYALSYIRYLN